MLRLNDDCLEHICKLLCFEDQISMKKVCRRLDPIMNSLWCHQCKKVTLNLIDLFSNDEEFVEFMTTICNTVEQLKFIYITTRHLWLLQNLRFPKVTKLELENLKSDDITEDEMVNNDKDDVVNDSENDDNDDWINRFYSHDDWINRFYSHHRVETKKSDDAILLISQLFPNLRDFKIYGMISGKYLERFTQLTDLDLCSCEFLRISSFERIFTMLRLRKLSILYYGYNTVSDKRFEAITKCHTLEELEMDDQHAMLIIDKLLQMPNLKKITCYTRRLGTYLTSKIVGSKAKAVEMFLSNDVARSNVELVEYLSKMINMKKLVFDDDDFEIDQGILLATKLKKLQHVCIRNCRLKSITQVLPFVEHCKELSILDISGNYKIDNDSVWKIVEILQKQNNRQLPLELRCFYTKIDVDLLELSNNSSTMNLLRLNKTERERELSPRFFQCKFSSNNELQ